MRSFKDMLSSMDDAALGSMCRDRYERLMDAHSMGLGDHPAEGWNATNKILRDHKVARDAAGSGLGARELEETDQPKAQDDPPPTSGTPAPPKRGAPTLDSAIPGYGRLLHRNRDTRVVDDDLIVQSRGSW